ncbi:MAG: FecR domain-containing protein [Lachnospiraceae bacterium]|nr:FecR domain-containing protein [Lachnospiraceae bacterium]
MKNKKIVFIIIGILLVVCIAIVAIVMLTKKDDSYRIIKVYEFEGDGVVNRTDLGDIEPYNNMVLESGDNIKLNTGLMTLKLDDDKYVYVEENTEFELEATGTSQDSKTTINLKSGAITNEIQNKLSGESSYEINTPNSTMAVRGTTYYVQVYEDDKGVNYTRVSVFEGKVTTKLMYADGTVEENEVAVDGGKEVIIYEDDTTTDYVGEIKDIDYSTLPDDVLLIVGQALEMDETMTDEEIIKNFKGPFTVTFIYNGNVFGTQTVKKGECAQMPSLMPAPSGSWDFDFNTPITEDVEIIWK